MPHFLHVAMNFRSGTPKMKELEPIFDGAIDWLRYAPNCWIVWTSRNPIEWHAKLHPHLGPDDTMLIVEINMANRYGWLGENLWAWMSRDRRMMRQTDHY